MATKSLETRASECFQKGQYDEAIKHYTLCLSSVSQTASKDTKATLLFNRSSCYLKQKLFENVVEDCSTILKFDTKNTRAYARKIKALCNGLGRFSEAHQTAKRWYAADSQNAQAKKEVERLEIILNAMKEQDEEDDDVLVSDRGDRGDGEERTPPEGKEADPDNISLNVTTSSGNVSKTPLQIKTSLPGTLQNGSRNNDNTDSDSASSSQSSVKSDNTAKQLHCVPCSMEFKNNEDLDVHLSSEVHRQSVSLEEDKNWKFRPPPRGLTSEEYTICPRQQTSGTCKYGTRCTHAHSDAELVEWKQRFDYRRHNSTSSGDQVAVKRSYAELLMEKWIRAENKDAVMKEAIENVKVHVNSDLTVTMSTKRCTNAWTFTLTSRDCLHRIILLDDASRAHYSIGSVTVGPKKSQKIQKVEDNCVEWTNPSIKLKGNNENVYRIKIVFKAEIFGTFRQSVVFDFGSEPVLYQQLCVDATPVSDIEKLQQDLIISEKGRWDLAKLEIIQYKPSPFPILDGDRQLLENYQPPVAEELRKSPSIAELNLSAENYRQRMHDLLYIEEMAQYASIARYNVKTALQIVDKFILLPANNATAKYAVNGELFARMKLNTEISEDTSHGRLILQTVNTVLLAPFDPKKKNKEPETVYEAMVEEKGKDFIMVRISKECVQELGLKPDKELNAEVQFQLNRLPVCEMHHAIDKLQDVRLVFPDLDHSISIPWTPRRQWSDKLDARLNTKQKEAIVAMTTSLEIELPPILLVGPYGTGKTFTLAQAAKQILQQEGTRILICTHSNSAADLYIKDYFHPYVEDNHLEAKPLRIYYRNRWIQTVNETVQKYCLIDPSFNFRMPTKEDIEGHRVIVATLSTSKYLYDIGLEPDCFTHILLDEAAQALECETIMPLAVASKKTRIVLAGDHMQMSPEVHSDFTRGRNLHISLLERLYDLYPGEQPCKILLCENYRSHKAILDYTSELFYDNKLVAGSKQPRHEVFYPLSFFTAKGEDVQHQNSTAFYNNAEVYEIVERISELKKMWPKSWGSQDDGAIGVVSPYADQVVRIRSELRKRKMGGVSVERVFNVQGKQFRAIFLSTVRTRNTCSTDTTMEDFMDFGFLSNAKLLTTAITRAQSLVAVVGDPVSLCSIGKCRYDYWYLNIVIVENPIY
ncbi:probable helicase with zinc finger domain [Lingula anatina]|uniref:Probable helicase with zinc finger domain n=1 Tax=Lingula anatina TaxID=7574 RepID=A0A1S3HBP3_LINAN|nr:probable helicase with zinc finger domain [Lingula anatina]|eukprot:XP_013382941.1 probable helicase with zinc finger domain [Lingula anatina]